MAKATANVSLVHVLNATAWIFSQKGRSPNLSEPEKAALENCIQNFNDIKDELRESLAALKPLRRNTFDAQMDDVQLVREAEVGLLLKSILEHEKQGKAVNLEELLNVCTANVLGQIMLSKRVFESQGAKASEFREMVVELMVLAGVFNIGDFVPSLAWMDLQGVQKTMKNLYSRFDQFFSRILEEHKAEARNGRGKNDFLSVLLSLRNDATDPNALPCLDPAKVTA